MRPHSLVVAVLSSLPVAAQSAAPMGQALPDAGPDASTAFPAGVTLQGSLSGGSTLSWWTADGNGATEDMLVRFDGGPGTTAVGPMGPAAGGVYGWVGDMVSIGGQVWSNTVLGRQLFTLDPDTGVCTPMGPPLASTWSNIHCLAYDAAGDRLFAVDMVQRQLLRIDYATSTASKLGNNTLSAWPAIRSLAYDPGANLLWAVDQSTDALLSISPTNGQASFVTTLAPHPTARIEELAFRDGELYASHAREDAGSLNRAQLQRIDRTTGAAEDLGPELTSVSAHCLLLNSLPDEVLWSQVSGPGSASFSDASLLDPDVVFSRPGVYVLALTVVGTGASDTLTVTSAGGEVFCSGDGSGSACPCGNTGAPGEGCANSTGLGSVLRNTGGVSAGADDAVFETTQLPPWKAGILFGGVNLQNGGSGVPFGDGLRCVKGWPLRRFPLQNSGAGGTITRSQPVQGSKYVITAGTTWYFQTWHRDAPTPCGSQSNLSNGYALTFGP